MLYNLKGDNDCRCPWCGKVGIYPSPLHIRTLKCKNCKNKYTIDNVSLIGTIIEKVFYIALIIAICIFHSPIQIGIIFIITIIIIIFSPFRPLKKYTQNDKILEVGSGFKASISFFKKITYNAKISSMFPEHRIYPICFVDENDTPISHMVCVCVDSYKRKTKTAELSFLPLGEKFDDVESGLKFYIFDKGEKIGEGKVIQLYNQGKTA